MAQGSLTAAGYQPFALRRLHSLSGVVPIGVFLIEHYLVNSLAFLSVERFNAAAKWLEEFPFVLVIEVGLIWLPILFHGLLGIYIWWQGRSNVGSLMQPGQRALHGPPDPAQAVAMGRATGGPGTRKIRGEER